MRILLSLAALLALTGAVFAADPVRPDPHLTPGATFPVTAEQVCTPGYAKSVRHVDGKTKAKVYREYGIRQHRPGEYEVDHLIPLGVGGSNEITNLWPQSRLTQPWNANVKDRLEDRLHAMVCRGEVGLQEAQHAIAADWIKAYERYIGQ